MSKRNYVRTPTRMTELAFKTVQARLSLKETQVQFAQRFRVSTTTIYHWEKGTVDHSQKIYKEILDSILAKLRSEGRLVPKELVETIFLEAKAVMVEP